MENEVITIEVDTVRKPYKKLLIAGFGAIPTRHFLEKLSPLLIERFKKEQITSVYEYLGNKKEVSDSKLGAAIHQHQPEAILIIYSFPEGPDTLAIKPQQEEMLWPLLLTEKRQKVINPKRSKLEKDLQAVLWEPAINKVIWRGQLHIFGNAAQDYFFQQVCGLLTDELRRYDLLVAAYNQ